MNEIAQLIKLHDYITRYEWDIYRYPTQYIRLKKDNWKKLYHLWSQPEELEEGQLEPTEKQSKFAKWKAKVTKSNQQVEEVPQTDKDLPKTEKKLKQYFLDRILKFQLKWATSTVTDVSFTNKRYEVDPVLKYFLQRFPDTFFVMYCPVFEIKQATVEAEIILISPIGIEIITLLEGNPTTVYLAGDERTWTIEKGNSNQSKRLSPLISLKRTEKIVKSILNKQDIDFPIQKTVLSRTNNIVFSTEPYHTKIVGINEYESWFQQKRLLTSPLKNRQLKAAEALLKQCQTNSIKRPEWEEDTSAFTIVGED